jgi:arsenate reductase
MAEGWAKTLWGDTYAFYSAGTKTHGLNPRAVQVMKEVGVDIRSHTSKTTDDLSDTKMDVVFTVCSDAHETCPVFPGGKIIHVGFDDPPRLTENMTNEEDILHVYRRVRDDIKDFITKLDTLLEERK